MPRFEFGITKAIRCYVTVEGTDEEDALNYLADFANESSHLVDDPAGRLSDYTDRDDVGEFDLESIDLVDEIEDEEVTA